MQTNRNEEKFTFAEYHQIRAYFSTGRYTAAIAHFTNQAAAEHKVYHLLHLALVYLTQGEEDKAILNFEEILRIENEEKEKSTYPHMSIFVVNELNALDPLAPSHFYQVSEWISSLFLLLSTTKDNNLETACKNYQFLLSSRFSSFLYGLSYYLMIRLVPAILLIEDYAKKNNIEFNYPNKNDHQEELQNIKLEYLCYLLAAGKYFIQKNNGERAIPLLEKIFLFSSTDASPEERRIVEEAKAQYSVVLDSRGMKAYTEKNYSAALADFNAVLTVNPNYANTHFNCGLVYFAKGNYQLALHHYTQSIKCRGRKEFDSAEKFHVNKVRTQLALDHLKRFVAAEEPMAAKIYFMKFLTRAQLLDISAVQWQACFEKTIPVLSANDIRSLAANGVDLSALSTHLSLAMQLIKTERQSTLKHEDGLSGLIHNLRRQNYVINAQKSTSIQQVIVRNNSFYTAEDSPAHFGQKVAQDAGFRR